MTVLLVYLLLLKEKKKIEFIFCSAFCSCCSRISFMIEGINQNHITHPYIIANISTSILPGCFLCCKQRIKYYFCMLINLTEEWAGNSHLTSIPEHQVDISVPCRSWGSECIFHLLPSPRAWSLCFIFAPRLFSFPFNPHLIPPYPLKGSMYVHFSAH